MKNAWNKKAHASRTDKMWLAYDILMDVGWQLAKNLAHTPENDVEKSVAEQIIVLHERYARFIKAHPYLIHIGWAQSAGSRANELIKDTFGMDSEGFMHPSFFVMAKAFVRICDDLCTCFPEKKNSIEVWGSMKELLEQVTQFSEWNPENYADPNEFYVRMKAILLDGVTPPVAKATTPKLEKLSLYEFFGDTIVLAKNRADAKAVLLRVKGWKATGRDIQGISPGEVFGDGRTAADVIEKWRWSAPCVVGSSE